MRDWIPPTRLTMHSDRITGDIAKALAYATALDAPAESNIELLDAPPVEMTSEEIRINCRAIGLSHVSRIVSMNYPIKVDDPTIASLEGSWLAYGIAAKTVADDLTIRGGMAKQEASQQYWDNIMGLPVN